MTGYRNEYLKMLKAEKSKKPRGRNCQNWQNPLLRSSSGSNPY